MKKRKRQPAAKKSRKPCVKLASHHIEGQRADPNVTAKGMLDQIITRTERTTSPGQAPPPTSRPK